MKKLKKEKAELVVTFENLKKQYRGTFVNIGNIIGADEDLENLIHKPNAKFWLEFKKKSGILAKISALDQTITKKEETIIALEKQLEVRMLLTLRTKKTSSRSCRRS